MNERQLPLEFFAGACRKQRLRVERCWPNGVPLKRQAIVQAVARGLDLQWLAQRVLLESEWQVYQEKIQPVEDAFWKVVRQAYPTWGVQSPKFFSWNIGMEWMLKNANDVVFAAWLDRQMWRGLVLLRFLRDMSDAQFADAVARGRKDGAAARS